MGKAQEKLAHCSAYVRLSYMGQQESTEINVHPLLSRKWHLAELWVMNRLRKEEGLLDSLDSGLKLLGPHCGTLPSSSTLPPRHNLAHKMLGASAKVHCS